MKFLPLTLLIFLPLPLVAGEVKTGDRIDSARSSLGVPRGRLHVGDRELFYFDRGTVEVSAGLVTRVNVRSEEDQTALENKRTTDAVRSREEQEINQARLITEGDALKTRKLSDPAFLATPLRYQVAFWEDFSRRYSAVSCVEQLSIARSKLAEQVQGEQVQAQRLAELEARIAEAEARAAEAEARADRARGYYSSYGNSYDYYPIFTASHPRHRVSIRDNNAVLICRSDSSRLVTQRRDDRSQFSSHTAMAFAGQDWLVWPSPAQARR